MPGSITHLERYPRQEILTAGSHGPQHAALTAEQAFNAISPMGEEKELHKEGPIMLRVAKHDPSKLLTELVWSQAKIRVFVSHEGPHCKYRIAFCRDDFFITDYYGKDIFLGRSRLRSNVHQVTPHVDPVVLGYAFKVRPPALWFLAQRKTNYCFASCLETLDGSQPHTVFESMTLTHTVENLLMFQEIFMENIPSHYPLVESFALFNGNSKILQVCNPIIQMWAVDPAPSVASFSASSSVSQLPEWCDILPTRPSQTNQMLVFTLESIFLLQSV